MTYTAPGLANGTPYDASMWQAALDEIERLSASSRSSLIAYKTSAETVTSSTTFQDDDSLFLAVEASKRFRFELNLLYLTPTAADLKFQFTFPTGMTGRYTLIGTPSGGSAISAFWRDQTSGGIVEGNAIQQAAYMVGTWVTSSTPGTLRLQWAQNVSNAGNTQVLDGSFMSLTEI